MVVDIPYPAVLSGSTEDKIQTIYTYLIMLRNSLEDSMENIAKDNLAPSLTEELELINAMIKAAQTDSTDAISMASNIPYKVSELKNDAGYINVEEDPTVPQWAKEESKPSYTSEEIPYTELSSVKDALDDLYAQGGGGGTPVDVPTKLSQLTNDVGFISEESDPTVPSWAKQETKPTYDASEIAYGEGTLSGAIDEIYNLIEQIHSIILLLCRKDETDEEV